MKRFDWDNPKLYKGSSTHYRLWIGVFYLLCGFGFWFILGGHTVVWQIIGRVLHL